MRVILTEKSPANSGSDGSYIKQTWFPLVQSLAVILSSCLQLSLYWKEERNSAVLCTKEKGDGENHTSCLMSNIRAGGSRWQESHLFQWGLSAADPKRACAVPAHQQDLPKHDLDAAEKLASHERASQLWHTTCFSLFLCSLQVFSRTGFVVSWIGMLFLFAWLPYFLAVYLWKKINCFLKIQKGLEVKRTFGRWEVTLCEGPFLLNV